MKFSKRDDTIDTDSNGFSNLNAPASSNTRRKPRSTSGQRKTTNDDRFAEDRRKIVSSETRSCLLSKLDQTMPIRSTPIPAPIKRWSRSQSVLNQITNSDFDAPPTSATNILENFLKELPPRNRATFVVANTVSLNEKSVNDRTVNPNIPDTVMKPKFEPAARVSSQMAKANEPSIIDVLNKPLTMKKAFEPNMKVEDKTRQTTPTKGTRKDEDPAAILIPTKPIADKPKFLPNRAGIDNEKNCDKEPIGLIPTEPLARPNFQPGRFHK
uniref:Uncharacterized protein n=1 Tax=Spongospora subterranea TaxID=70186 RepID=A0A0H5RAU3_9EUKA|eukprot:CRZ10767.1 hypothetical protein [Spongospora subterranea]